MRAAATGARGAEEGAGSERGESARTSATASTMPRYPVQRQRLPASSARIRGSSASGRRRAMSQALTSIPGVQYPHWRAWRRVKAPRSAFMSASSANPSMVRTSAPSQAAANAMHDRAGTPSMSTVQAPHTPCSQPRWVPVRWRCSRRKSARWVRGSGAPSTCLPFTTRRTPGRASAPESAPSSASGSAPFPEPERTGEARRSAGRSAPSRARARTARASAAAWSCPPAPTVSLAERSACASATVSGNAISPSTTSGARSIAPTTARLAPRSGSSNTTASACANSPLLAASLQYPRRAAGDGRGTRTAARTSASVRVVANGPRMKERSGSTRAPPGPSIHTSAPTAASTTGQSAAGSAWARLPPMVPRLRIARYAMLRAARESHPGVGSGTVPSSISAWVIAAP